VYCKNIELPIKLEKTINMEEKTYRPVIDELNRGKLKITNSSMFIVLYVHACQTYIGQEYPHHLYI
jgi:hypothetical protein